MPPRVRRQLLLRVECQGVAAPQLHVVRRRLTRIRAWVDVEDDEPDAVAMSADENARDLSAEEEAVHLTTDPPLGELGDGYVTADIAEDDA